MSAPERVPFASKILSAYQGNPPDWVAELASLADQSGLAGAGHRINYSPSAVSAILSNTYRGDRSRVEHATRGALMGLTVQCPILGELPRNQCLDWQALPFSTSDSTRARIYRACRNGCEHSRKNGAGK